MATPENHVVTEAVLQTPAGAREQTEGGMLGTQKQQTSASTQTPENSSDNSNEVKHFKREF